MICCCIIDLEGSLQALDRIDPSLHWRLGPQWISRYCPRAWKLNRKGRNDWYSMSSQTLVNWSVSEGLSWLLIKMSMIVNFDLTFFANSSIDFLCDKSKENAVIVPPAFLVISVTAYWFFAVFLAPKIMLWPYSYKVFAVSYPMPLFAPVITIFFGLIRNS